MKRVPLLIGAIVLLFGLMAVVGFQRAPAQDDTEERIEELEDRVSELETAVAELQNEHDDRPREDERTETHDITLSIVLLDSDNITGSMSNCRGKNGYDDLRNGASVVVMDGEGTIIASSRLGPGTKTTSPRTCTFETVIEDVPEVAFYQFEIEHRGAPRYSLEDMEASGWEVQLEIGRT